ncbi:MAG: acetyl-CoA carboxylase biotin carboxyl carrier protein [Candidatus Limnocylindrales bacterium]
MTDDHEPTAVGPGPGPTSDAGAPAPRDDGDVALLRLIDRLSALLERSDLTELEVEAGETGLVLRKPAALSPVTVGAGAAGAAVAAGAGGSDTGQASSDGPTTDGQPVVPAQPSIKAPLTGIFYASPAPGSAPYVAVGGEVAVGQIIGLIEAMKLFNEIKSDLAGRVVRVVAESGTLVKSRQPLIEVDPL